MVISLSSIGTRLFHVHSPDHSVLHLEVGGYQTRFEQVVSGQQFFARVGIRQHSLDPLEHVRLEFVVDALGTYSSNKDIVRDGSIIRTTRGIRHLKRAGNVGPRNERDTIVLPINLCNLTLGTPSEK